MWVWYLDRSAGIVALVALWLSVLTGIAYNARGFGPLHRASRILHLPASVVASTALLAHVAIGLIDAGIVLARQVPHPAYSDAYFLVGLGVGIVALLVIVTSTLAFIDPKRFERPWDPRLVHAFAYFGFVAAIVHAIALGSDLYSFALPGLVAATLLLLGVLIARVIAPEPIASA